MYSYKLQYDMLDGFNAVHQGHGFETMADASKEFAVVLRDFMENNQIPRPKWWQFWKFKQDVRAYVGYVEGVNNGWLSCEVSPTIGK